MTPTYSLISRIFLQAVAGKTKRIVVLLLRYEKIRFYAFGEKPFVRPRSVAEGRADSYVIF
jgi:hypothetical protein